MFDIAFQELIIIAIVALIVIGPEKLPKIARGAGLVLGRMQRYVNTIKSDIDKELQTEDLKQLQNELRQQDLGLNDELRKGMQPVETVLQQTRNDEAHAAPDSESQDTQPASTENENASEKAEPTPAKTEHS